MEKFENAKIELVLFDARDVITSSGGEGDIPLDPTVWFGDEGE